MTLDCFSLLTFDQFDPGLTDDDVPCISFDLSLPYAYFGGGGLSILVNKLEL